MSSVILTNWTVYYEDDAPAGSSGQKQIKWTGSGGPETDTNTVLELYSAIADLFSIPAQNVNDATTPLRAITPSAYEIGSFDQRDLEPWFIDPGSVEHLTGGALQTINWTRVTGGDANSGNSGIVKVHYTVSGFQFVESDIGRAIVNGTATGTLIWYDTTNSEAWIRPTSSISTHDWAGPAGNILVTSGTGDVTQNGAAVTGERLWPNIYSIGTISDGTRLAVFQNFSELTNFWGDGHIDRLFLVNDGFASGLIDSGQLVIFARQYSQLYDHFTVDVTNGGRNPIPLSTSDDINNDTGYGLMTVIDSSGVSDFDVANYIYAPAAGGWSAATKKGVITAVGGTATNPIVTYYLIGDLTDFVSTDTVKEYDPATGGDGDGSLTAPTPTTTGPAAVTGVTMVFGNVDEDIGDGNGNQPYDVTIDCNGYLLSAIYEYFKYLNRRGSTGDIDTGSQTVTGERYLTPGDVRIPYDGQTGNFTEGATLTGQTSGATGIVTADDDAGTTGTLIVRDVRGTFDDTAPEEIRDDGVPGIANIVSGGIETTLVSKVSPFGTYAGGKFFGARGVFASNMHADDANNYQLTDSNDVARDPPSSYSVAINVQDSAGAAVEDAQVFVRQSADYYSYTSHNTLNAIGDTTFEVNEAVDIDLPQSGWLHIWDASTNTKQNYRYQSWTGKIFTLNATVSGSTTSTHGTDPTFKLVSTSTNFTTADIEEGDTIRNTTTGAWAVVDEIVDADNITTSVLSSGQWTSGDGFSFHTLAITLYLDTDLVDIPLLNAQTNASGDVSLTYLGSVPNTITVRIRSNEGETKYIPFKTSGSITASGYSLTAILSEDTVST